MTIDNASIDDIDTQTNDNDSHNSMINDTALDDTSHDNAIPNVNDTTFSTKVNFVDAMNATIYSKDIDMIAFFEQDTHMINASLEIIIFIILLNF